MTLIKLLKTSECIWEFKLKGKNRPSERSHGNRNLELPCSMLEAPPGSEILISGFSTGISQKQRERLQAYGLAPGMKATIMQTSPVVVVQVENLELVLEPQLARKIQVVTT